MQGVYWKVSSGAVRARERGRKEWQRENFNYHVNATEDEANSRDSSEVGVVLHIYPNLKESVLAFISLHSPSKKYRLPR